ncbi:MAG: glycosyltransferase [Clostridium sp.]|nr:glycosyltransferase [Clostridium sp.]
MMDKVFCDNVLSDIKNGDIYFDDLEALFQILQNEPIEMRHKIANVIYSEIGKEIKYDIYLYSYLIRLKPEIKYIEELCLLTLNTDKLDWKQLNFVFGQINSILFLNPEIYDLKIVELHWKILYKAFELCKREMNLELEPILANERREDLVIVITEQFLIEQHGPTKTALDRCYVLQKIMNKRVFLINTAEALSLEGYIPFYDARCGNYIPELLESDTVNWKGETFLYYQCEQTMPNIMEMQNLINTVKILKPSMIIGVGVTGLVSGFINEMIPMIDIGLTQSGVETTLADYQVVEHSMLDVVQPLIKAMGKDMAHIIPGKFTFSLKEQTQFLTRADCGINDEAFVMAIVGGRLDTELDEQFMSFLNDTLRDNMVVVIMGVCDTLESKLLKYPRLKNYILNFGFCDDILSYLELCDLYVNPTRKGGGTSAVEAMFKGKPVVTVSYGDVAGIAGDRFSCENYTEMKKLIEKYYEDKEFYDMQAQYAKETADICMDSETEFVRIVGEYEKKMA